MRETSIFCAALAAIVAARSAPALAQYATAQERQQQLLQQYRQLPMADLKGTVERVANDGISIKCDGQPFIVKIDPSFARVQCTGKAERGYLKTGLMVRFEGEFDRRMQPQGPIEEVTVVTPSETAQPGIHSDAIDDEQGGRKRGTTDSYVIIGLVKLIKDGQMNVMADDKSIKVQLAKDAEVGVDIDDFLQAEAGDEIAIKGRMVQPPQGAQAGQVIAEDVTIALANPLQSDAKAPAKRKKIKRPAR